MSLSRRLVRGLHLSITCMENDYRTIREVVKAVRDSGGEELAAVRCSDGSYGVTCQGRLLETLRWDQHQLEECLQFLERFARTS